MIPGEIISSIKYVEINKDLEEKKIKVVNKGDRPIQVGSHFHFFEVNKYLTFNREEAFGYRLDIPSGTAIRFEPNIEKEVDLVQISGNRRIKGLNNLTDAQVNESTKQKALNRASEKYFR